MIDKIGKKTEKKILNYLPVESFEDLSQPYLKEKRISFVKDYFMDEAAFKQA